MVVEDGDAAHAALDGGHGGEEEEEEAEGGADEPLHGSMCRARLSLTALDDKFVQRWGGRSEKGDTKAEREYTGWWFCRPPTGFGLYRRDGAGGHSLAMAFP